MCVTLNKHKIFSKFRLMYLKIYFIDLSILINCLYLNWIAFLTEKWTILRNCLLFNPNKEKKCKNYSWIKPFININKSELKLAKTLKMIVSFVMRNSSIAEVFFFLFQFMKHLFNEKGLPVNNTNLID